MKMMLMRTPQERRVTLLAATLLAVALAPWSSVDAAYTLDRWYRMGDDPDEPAVPGTAAGTGAFGGRTYDSKGAPGQNNLQDLTPVGSPLYVDISGNRPFPENTVNNRAIQFNGTTQYLFGQNLNSPEDADIATGQIENYTGIRDRGYQMWVMPTSVTPDVTQFILDDADRHAVLVNATGNFAFDMRGNAIQPTPLSAVTLDETWVHLAQVRRNGDFGGAWGWVNGRAYVSQTGEYTTSTVSLAVAADAEPDLLGGSTFTPGFAGLIAEIEMFVLGGSFGTFDYTRDNGYFTDVFLPSTSGYSFVDNNGDGHNDNMWLKGDLNFDGMLSLADVNTFIAGWRSSGDALAGVGPRFGDYVTLGKGDMNLDGVVDAADWVLLRASGISLGSGGLEALLAGLVTVPEPSTALMALLAATALVAAPRRGRTL